MPNWKKLIVSGSAAELSTLKLTGLSGQGSETTSLMINGSNVIGTRDLGSNAFTSTTIPTNNNQLTNGAGYTTNTGTVTSVAVTTGTGLNGATTITTSGTVALTLDLSELTDMTADVDGTTDELILLDDGVGKRKQIDEIKLSQFNNDSGFTTNTGDITGVTAGDGLSGGGSSGGVTLAVDYAGTDNIILTATAYTDTIDTGDYILVSDSSNNVRYNTVSNLPFTNNSGDITQVNITAGDGLTGDVNTTSGAHTQTIDVDSTVVRTSGTQTVGGSKTFSSETTFTAGIQLNDSDVITLGTGDDYEILDDGTDTLFRGRRHEGKLYFQMENDGGTLQNAIILGSSGSAGDVGVELRYNNVARIWTTSGGTAIMKPSIVGLSAQSSEATALMINGSNVVGTRELGSNAFTSTTIGTTSNALTVDNTTIQLNSGTTFNGSAARTISAKTAAISDGGTALATADQIHTFVTSFGYTTNTGDITGVTAGTGLSGGGSSGGVTLALDLSELSAVTPTSGDSFATLDSDGSTEQLTTVDALATLLAGSGLNASEGVLSVTETGDISAVTAGEGLIGGGSSGAVTLNVDYDGSDNIILACNNAEATGTLSSSDKILVSSATNDNTFVSTLSNLPFTNNSGDITGVTAGTGLSGGGSSGGVTLALDLSELSEVTPASGDALATLDSDGSTEQLTTVDALATLFAGGNGLAASSGVMSVSGNLTGITSIYNATLSVGRGATNAALHFDTDETMMFAANNETQLLFKDGVVEPNTDDNYDLGSSSKEFKDLYIDGTAYIDAINFNGTAISATATELNKLDGATITTSELNLIDGGTARGTTTVSEGDGFLHNDAGTMRMTNVSKLADLFAGTGLTASEGVLSVNTLNQDTSGNAGTATALATARTISGVSFDGTANITLNNSNITNGAGYTTNTGTVDTSGTPVDNDFAKFTDANTIEGRNATEVKTDLSLNNVENTAISTFAGTSNITTVGTIGTGTWQGTAIASAYLDSDTAHLSGTQTFSGAKTFSSHITVATDGGIKDSGGTEAINVDDSANVELPNGLLTVSGTGTSEFTSHLKAHCLGIGTNPSGTQGEIRATNDITAYYSSDIRLKENIHSLKGTLEKLDSIRAVSYDWKELTEEERKTVHSHTGSDIGVIAQEVEEVFPNLVEDRPNGYKAVNYEKLSAVLLSAVKELKQEVEELKQKIK